MAKIDELAAIMKACGHPLRLKILCAIQMGEETCVSELWNCLDQSQPVVSQHLAVLKRRGIVKSEVQGNKRVYRICDPFVRTIVSAMVDSVDEVKQKIRSIQYKDRP
ncbi:MAG: helix-turn-helix transcriptional regulator [Spirochaetaceae bacterium]|nr:MAG: helix-turn-helix transcriptional regulator [Spirochaetaceae bacterium]